MISPYKGRFRITQIKHATHDGLDMVGIDSKEIHATTDGVVVKAGWEDEGDHSKGFGLYVVIKPKDKNYHFLGHLSEITVKEGQEVELGDLVGIEGSTGRSTGSHVHFCIRYNRSKAAVRDVSALTGIPNALGVYGEEEEKPSGVTTLLPGRWNVRKGPSLGSAVARVVKGPQSVTYVDIVPESNPKVYGKRNFYLLRDGCYISTKACK